MKALLLIHRYLGIALGVLMVVWCLSGIVMMYVPYPYLSEAERIAHLPPLADSTAAAVASEFADRHEARLLDVIDHDQWTVQGAHGRDRPLFHFSLNDAAGTEVYVSSVTGKAVQVTSARQRFWNWFGAVPHWIYFSNLRQYPGAWSQVVVWTSLLGTFLTLTGLYIGLHHWRPRRGVRWIPYRGLQYWHHLSGLVFGPLLLTWVFSGLVSMNPWGFLDSGKAAPLNGQRIESKQLITAEDDYYFSHQRERVSLPVYRIILADAQQTRYYVDPVSGQALAVVDRNRRWYRWLHQALHRIDFTAAVRASPARDVFMVTVLVGMALVCALGTYLGLRR